VSLITGVRNGSWESDLPHRDVLAVRALSKHFGGIRALHDISFSVARGSINSLIGPNGAGKTTFINVVTGVFGCEGEISFEGENIAGLPAHVVASKGIGRTFQLEELFPSLTVLEKCDGGCHIHTESGMLSFGMRIPFLCPKEESEIRVAALECLKVVDTNAAPTSRSRNFPSARGNLSASRARWR